MAALRRWLARILDPGLTWPDPIELTAAEVRGAGAAALHRLLGGCALAEYQSLEDEVGALLKKMTHRAAAAFAARCASRLLGLIEPDADPQLQADLATGCDLISRVEGFAAGSGFSAAEDKLDAFSFYLVFGRYEAWADSVLNACGCTESFGQAVRYATDSAIMIRCGFGYRALFSDLEVAIGASRGHPGTTGEPVRLPSPTCPIARPADIPRRLVRGVE